MNHGFPTRPALRPSTSARFRTLLRAVTQAALASSAAGCPSDHTVSADGDWDPIACDRGPVTVADAKTTREVDYIAIYRQYSSEFVEAADGGVRRSSFELAVMGKPCSGADDANGCKEQLAEIASCEQACGPFVVAGSSGTFKRLDSRAELLTLLGDVDAVADAVLLAIYDGHTLCDADFSSDEYDFGGEIRAARNGYQTRATWEACGAGVFHEELSIDSNGKVEQLSYKKLDESLCAIGRRPFGLCDGKPTLSRTGIGGYLAQAAHLEAASVYAFQKLVRELEAFGAPQELIDAAIDAVEDELAHTRDVARLARAYGATTVLPEVAPSSLRSKLEVALDNISEGCVRETFGAVVATYQAECASDPRVRAVMRKIAEDETQHARLSWQLQAWLSNELSEPEVKLVEAEKARAMQQLSQAFESGLEPAEERALGFPSVEAANSLFNGLRQTLWMGSQRAEVG